MEASGKSDEISLKELLQHAKVLKKYILRWKYVVLGVAFAGASIGLAASFLIKPKYTAKLSFALQDDKSSSGGSLSSLASQFGLSIGGGTSGVFGGDNLFELFTSQHLIENTLLCPTQIDGKTSNLLNLYIDTYRLRERWVKSSKKELQNLQFPLSQSRNTFTRVQDSIMQTIYADIVKRPLLTAVKRDKKLSIGDITFVSENENLSKLFVENLIRETSTFYIETKTKVSRQNYDMLRHQADSVKAIFDYAVAARASMADNALNAVRQSATVGVVRKQTDMQVAAATYAEMKKNLEVLKMSINQDTPLIQIIDDPTFPLHKEKLGKIKGVLIGGFAGALLAIFFFILVYAYNSIKQTLMDEEVKTADVQVNSKNDDKMR